MAAKVTQPCRFPPPRTIVEANDTCFIVRDHNSLAVAYVYFEDEPSRRVAASGGACVSSDRSRRLKHLCSLC